MSLAPKSPRIAIVGASGVVGQEMESIIKERLGDAAKIDRFASRHRVGPPEIHSLEESWELLLEADYILGAADADTAKKVASKMRKEQFLIDNSSAFRMNPDFPLVVPEINATELDSLPQIVANPNCTAILLCVSLAPLKKYTIKRVVVSTYQAASGAGLKGLEELEGQIQGYLKGNSAEKPSTEVFKQPLFLNVLSHNSELRPKDAEGAGYNDEEWKVLTESRKILQMPELAISATCMRVPVKRAHTETVSVDLEKSFELENIKKEISEAAGLKLTEDPEHYRFPMPLEAQNQDLVLVGRYRKDPFLPQTLHYILAGDQLRKGAASNAVQIMLALHKRRS